MPRVSVDLSEKLNKDFTEKCRKDHRKKVEVIRELIEEWLKNE